MEAVNWQPASLEDGLVKLIPLTESDFDRLYRVAADPLIWEQHPSFDRYKENVFRGFFNGALESKAAFLIVDKAADEVIGCTRYYDCKADSVAIGFTFLARKYWGGKYNKAVKKLMIDYAFGLVDKIIFHIGANNLRSQIATGRLGVVKTGEVVTKDEYGERVSFEYTLGKKLV